MDSVGIATQARPRVFISYSRDVSAAADAVRVGLSYGGGVEVFIDQDAIHEGEAWRQRLRDLIRRADVVLFLLSPSSAASKECAWEVSEAAALSKRLLPARPAGLCGAELWHALGRRPAEGLTRARPRAVVPKD